MSEPSSASAASPQSSLLYLENISKSYGPLRVLNDVSLDVRKGQVVCLIGPSGAGKSTLLRCVNHLETISSGTIYFEGEPVYRYMKDERLSLIRIVGSKRRAPVSAWCSSRSICFPISRWWGILSRLPFMCCVKGQRGA